MNFSTVLFGRLNTWSAGVNGCRRQEGDGRGGRTCARDGLVRDDIVERDRSVLFDPVVSQCKSPTASQSVFELWLGDRGGRTKAGCRRAVLRELLQLQPGLCPCSPLPRSPQSCPRRSVGSIQRQVCLSDKSRGSRGRRESRTYRLDVFWRSGGRGDVVHHVKVVLIALEGVHRHVLES